MAWALALSMTISSSPSRLSSLSSRRFPMNLATRQYMEFSGTILISSGKWYPYHSLQGQDTLTEAAQAPPRLRVSPGHPTVLPDVPPGPHRGPVARPAALGELLSLPGLYRRPEQRQLPVVSMGRERGPPNPLNPPKPVPTDRTRMEKVLMSLSSWSSRLMDWMIMLSTRCTLNFTLARE